MAEQYRPQLTKANISKLKGLLKLAPVATDMTALANKAVEDWAPDWAKKPAEPINQEPKPARA